MSSRRARRKKSRNTTRRRKGLLEGLIGRPSIAQFSAQVPPLRRGLFDPPAFGARKLEKSPELQLTNLIKSIEKCINRICDEDPDPIQVVNTCLVTRKKISQILKIAKPLAVKKQKLEKIKKQIEDLRNNPDYKWNSKSKQFVKRRKKK